MFLTAISRRAQRHVVLQMVAVFVLAMSGPHAHAQFGGAISESQLTGPWEKHLTALRGLENQILNLPEGDARTAVEEALFALESEIGTYESQVGEVINRLAGDPQFSYVADQTSLELSRQLDVIHGLFETMYGALQATEREDVRAAQESLDKIRTVLRQKREFEMDVVNALGSGQRQNIVGLATRWWHGEEKAAQLREYISALRPKLE